MAASLRPLSAAAVLLFASFAASQSPTANSGAKPAKIGRFKMDFHVLYGSESGLPSIDVHAVAVDGKGRVFAGTAAGLARLENGKWKTVAGIEGPVAALARDGNGLLVAAANGVAALSEAGSDAPVGYPAGVAIEQVNGLLGGSRRLLASKAGVFELRAGSWQPFKPLAETLRNGSTVHQMASGPEGKIAVAAEAGLFLVEKDQAIQLFPHEGQRSWAPRGVRGVAFDRDGNLWFASPQGAGKRSAEGWRLYTGYEGLPYDDFTTMVSGPENAVWFGCAIGAIRFDNGKWSYRQGRRWLADDRVRSIAVGTDGTAWFATSKGVSAIERRETTLAEKARFFEEEIDRYHRRTPFEYVLGVGLTRPGDKSSFRQHDSDNDGLWTSMYGAAEAFAYAASKDPKARDRAKKAFEAVAFLSEVTQGGSHPAPHGFPARTILPTDGENPNAAHYTREKDERERQRDPLWKVLVPRWPTSADGKWYWKTDTSSDELDGHYFLYAIYYDLVAETPEEKARVREVVTRITDHLIDHDFELIDHDGKPTRWGRFSPKVLNGDILVNCRGLNSLSVLSYLKVAEHVTGGGKKYKDAYDQLVNVHHYAVNALAPKAHYGVGTGNQSDDEMAFMCYYTLLSYEKDPVLLAKYYRSFAHYFTLEAPERCPLFNFIFLAKYRGGDRARMQSAQRFQQTHLDEAVESLMLYPLDRIRWGQKNSHRKDVELLRGFWGTWNRRKRGHLRDGRVLPIDERFVEHWNHDPWILDEEGNGHALADGASFLLPYYMGLHFGFIAETSK